MPRRPFDARLPPSYNLSLARFTKEVYTWFPDRHTYLQEENTMLVPMRILLDHAAKNGYGIAAFNVNNMEQIQAIMEAALETDSPVIIQASRGARKYTNDAYLRHLMLAAAELYPKIPIAMHQDHGNSPETCLSAIQQAFTSVMMDGSLMEDGKTPSTYDYNVKVTRQVVKAAHAKGVTVEAEIGTLGGIEDGHGAGLTGEEALKHLTDPDQAERFVQDTEVDALAVAIGTSHGAYKFSRPPTGEVLVMSLIEEIHRRLPNTHLVMHGSSSVPQELLEIIRRHGGKMKETYGVPVEEIQRGIQHGVRKINVDTDNRLAMTGAIRKVFAESPEKFDPRDYLGDARAAMKKVCVARMVAFGQAGNAGKINPVTCKQMVTFYKAQGAKKK
jgi:fructose-bisphosphate aldolase, class II